MGDLDRWLIERILIVLFATMLVHTLEPLQNVIVQMFGAIAGIAVYEIGHLLVRTVNTRKGSTKC